MICCDDDCNTWMQSQILDANDLSSHSIISETESYNEGKKNNKNTQMHMTSGAQILP